MLIASILRPFGHRLAPVLLIAMTLMLAVGLISPALKPRNHRCPFLDKARTAKMRKNRSFNLHPNNLISGRLIGWGATFGHMVCPVAAHGYYDGLE